MTGSRSPLRGATLVAVLGLYAAGTATAQTDPTDEALFFKVKRLFNTKCYECHGREARGGLRLDSRESALRGGNSGVSLLHDNLPENEIYRRVSSTDPQYMMPPTGKRLTDEEVGLVRSWVEAGAPWVVGTESEAEDATLVFRLRNMYVTYIRPHKFIWLTSVLLLIATVEAWRWLGRRQHRWTLGRGRLATKLIRWLHPSLYVIGLLLGVVLIQHYRFTFMTRENENLEATRRALVSNTFSNKQFQAFGRSLVPERPDGPLGISKTYYRGNCERSPKLFNHGHYLTARLRVSLLDSSFKELAVGDGITKGKHYIQFEIRRAPGTADAFFSPKIMDGVFLSRSSGVEISESADGSVILQRVEGMQQWVARFPIQLTTAKSAPRQREFIYVHYRYEDAHQTRFAIEYDLVIHKGRIVRGSDIWLGTLWPDPGVPKEEWFSAKPIPIITGRNSTDPKLLGLDEHAPRARTSDLRNAVPKRR